jgi:phosphoglucosamine mutase
MGRWFGTDGIRGKANVFPMDAATALTVGQAIAAYYAPNEGSSHIAIGWDTRISGEMLAHAVAAGICSVGVDVELLGVLPTPGVARDTVVRSAAAGIVISASHNPYFDNGIKVFGPNGIKPTAQDEEALESLIADPDKISKAPSTRIGRINQDSDASGRYLSFLLSIGQPTLEGKKIVIDCAHGATYQVAPHLFKRLGANLTTLSCAPDGININDQCGSQHPEKLAETVLSHQADVGLAFDGDGDRLIAVDDKGRTLTGDQILAICAKDLMNRGELRNGILVSTVMSNMGLHQAMKELGISLFTTPVGDRHVMEKMLREDAVLGGEDSGHMIFRQHHTTGDGIVAALMLIAAMQRAGRPLSDLASRAMTVFPQVLINVDVREKSDLSSIPSVAQALRLAEEQLGDRGRLLVRYSGTQNQCRVMVEGPTQELTQQICRRLAAEINSAIGV